MTQPREINIARDFSRFPAGRFLADGPFSGEKFRIELLAPALASSERVVVQLDGTMGYGSSFLEEAFGGLVRIDGFTAAELHEKLVILSDRDRSLVTEAWSYVDAAKRDNSAR